MGSKVFFAKHGKRQKQPLRVKHFTHLRGEWAVELIRHTDLKAARDQFNRQPIEVVRIIAVADLIWDEELRAYREHWVQEEMFDE